MGGLNIILKKIILDHKTFYFEKEFEFQKNLTIIVGPNGSGKTYLLHIINLLKMNTEDSLHKLFYGDDENYYFKYEIHFNGIPTVISIKVENLIMSRTSKPEDFDIDLEEISGKIILISGNSPNYTNFDNSDIDSINTSQSLSFSQMSMSERFFYYLINSTNNLENHLILIDDLFILFDTEMKQKIMNHILTLSKHNQVIITMQPSIFQDLRKEISNYSLYILKNPWQKSVFNFYSSKKDLKSENYKEFSKSMKNIQNLLDLKLNITDINLRKFLIRLLYANVITAMETYLSDCFINNVISNKKFIPKLLEHTPALKKTEMSLKKAYDWIENIEENIIDFLSGITFHNLSRVLSLYSNVLGINISGDLGIIFRAIIKRHDIVHRNGKTTDHAELNLKKSDLIDLMEKVKEFITKIEDQTKNL